MGKLTEINKNKLKNALYGIELTAAEQKTVEWLAKNEPETIDNLCNIIEKAKDTQSKNQKLLLDWAKATVKELDKLKDDRSARILRDGGEALIKEIEQERPE